MAEKWKSIQYDVGSTTAWRSLRDIIG